MKRVGNERETSCENTADGLGDSERHIDDDRPEDARVSGIRIDVMVMMMTAHGEFLRRY